ncbi:hypothetical protein JCM6882_000283 [Rhodosporidiobolus microsporus]
MAPAAKKAAPAAAAKAQPKGKDSPIGPKKRKLACFPCRERRVRCDWPEGGGGCAACALARLKCPGEPAPKKRLKKGEVPPREGPSEVDLRMAKFQFGSAVTFQLIEMHLQVANPCIPGMPFDFFRDFLKQAGGKSREMEIAAEVFCGAFVATSAAFTDHVMIIGTTDLDQPFDSPLGIRVDYTPFHPIGQRRREALEALSLNARQIFEDSGMRLRPSVEAIYALYTMDEMVVLAGERGRGERQYVGLMCGHWRTMLGQKKGELTPEQVEQLRGPLGVALLLLDAETATTLRQPCTITDSDLSALVPHLSAVGAATPVFDPVALANEETGWEALGEQLVPLTFHIPTTLTPFYTALDSAYSTLSTAAHVIASLPPLPDRLDTAWRAFDLFSLVNQFRRSVLRLDLLAHQRVIEALLQSQKPPTADKPNNRGAAKGKSAIPDPPPAPTVLEPAGPPSPPPALLQAYAVSRQRVHRAFGLAAEMARHAIDTSSLVNARRLAETLEVCSSWTSMRNADPAMAAELCGELGIGAEMGQVFLQLLSLCSWSSHSALFLHQGLLGGLTLLNNSVPLPACPYPPASGLVLVAGKPERIDHCPVGGGYRPGAYTTGSAHMEGSGRRARRKEAKRRAEEADTKEKLFTLGRPIGSTHPATRVASIASARSSMVGTSATASTASITSKKEAEDFVPDWSFLDEYMTPEDKAREAANRAAAAAAPPPPPAAAPNSLAPVPSVSTNSSSGSSSRSISSAMKQAVRSVAAAATKRSPASTNQVQSRLEAAAAPLFFKPSFKLRNPPSINSVIGGSSRRQQQQQAAPPPPPPPQQRSMQPPVMQQHYPSPASTPVPHAAAPTYPVTLPTPPVHHHVQQSAYPVQQPAAYPYTASLPPPPQGFAPSSLPHAPPQPPSFTSPLPSAAYEQQPAASHYDFSSAAPQPAVYPSAAFPSQFYPQPQPQPQSLPPSHSPPLQQYASFPTPTPHYPQQHLPQPSYPHAAATPQPTHFAGTPTAVLPSYPVPTPIVDSTAEALALEPLDAQTLALLASLPAEGGADVNMGGMSPVLGGGGGAAPDWGMQGVEQQYQPQQQQQHSHQHQQQGWM